MRRRWLVAAIAVFACFVSATTSLADGPTSPGVSNGLVEVTRYTLQGDNIIERQIVIATAQAAASPDTVADQVAGAQATAMPPCVSTAPTEVVAQYCLNSWAWPSGSIPVHVSYNPAAPAGHDVPSAADPIQNAIQQWSSVTSTFAFVYDGATTAAPSACDANSTADGVNAVAWVANIGSANSGVLAQTCTVRTPDGALEEFDMQLSAAMNWSVATPTAGDAFDLYSNILHEFGHAAGIAHSQYPDAVMFQSLNSGVEKRTLTNDDKQALIAQYGGATALSFRLFAGDIARD